MKTYEGSINSCDPNNHVYKYLAEHKGRILYVGDDLPSEHGGAPREVLGEGSLLPCSGDPHIHFASHALFNASLDVRSARSMPELGERIRKFAREMHTVSGVGEGYRQERDHDHRGAQVSSLSTS